MQYQWVLSVDWEAYTYVYIGKIVLIWCESDKYMFMVIINLYFVLRPYRSKHLFKIGIGISRFLRLLVLSVLLLPLKKNCFKTRERRVCRVILKINLGYPTKTKACSAPRMSVKAWLVFAKLTEQGSSKERYREWWRRSFFSRRAPSGFH